MKAWKFLFVSAVMVAAHVLSGGDSANLFSALVGHAQSACPVRGSCNLEPGLQGRTDLLLFEDFEDTNWQPHWTNLGFPTNISAVPTAFQGARGVEVRIPTGMHDGGSLTFDFRNAGIADPEEIYFRYYLRFNDSWQRNGDGEIGKLPGIGGSYDLGAGHGCTASNGTNGWTARMINFDRGAVHQVGFYAYHVDMAGQCGEHMLWPTMLERNRWYSIEVRARINTISGGRGNNDGVLQGWIDDELVFSRTNLRFRDVDTIKIEKIWGNVFMGGSWVADRPMAIHFDNMVIARSRIGSAGSGTSTPPRPPTNLRIIS
jgi:hypothetical protein